MPSETLFVDTNVLLTATVPARRHHDVATEVLRAARRHRTTLVCSGQVLREYLATATRPIASNGLGLHPRDAVDNADTFARRVRLLDEGEATTTLLRAWTRDLGAVGRQVHDANIAATMHAHGVRDLLTADPADFRRYEPRITVHALATWSWREAG